MEGEIWETDIYDDLEELPEYIDEKMTAVQLIQMHRILASKELHDLFSKLNLEDSPVEAFEIIDEAVNRELMRRGKGHVIEETNREYESSLSK